MDFLDVPARLSRGDRLRHVDGQLNSHSVRIPSRAPPQRDEVIVKIAAGVNPVLILGKHKYKNILNAGWPWDPSPESCVFMYNYQSNGDPSDRAYIVIFLPIYAHQVDQFCR